MIHIPIELVLFIIVLSAIGTVIIGIFTLCALEYPEQYLFNDLNFTGKKVLSDIGFVLMFFIGFWLCLAILSNSIALIAKPFIPDKVEIIEFYDDITDFDKHDEIRKAIVEGYGQSTAFIIDGDEIEKITFSKNRDTITYSNETTHPYLIKRTFKKNQWIFYSSNIKYEVVYPNLYEVTNND